MSRHCSDAKQRASRKYRALHTQLAREIGTRPIRFTEPCKRCRHREDNARYRQTGAGK